MKIPQWLKDAAVSLFRDELRLIVRHELMAHGVAVPVSADSPGVLIHEEKK